MLGNNSAFSMPVVPMGYANGNGNNNGSWGDDWLALAALALIFGWGNGGFGMGGFGMNGMFMNPFMWGGFPFMWGGGWNGGHGQCATQSDVREAVDQQTLISKIDQQTYGMADSFTALNNTLNNNFRSIDNAICTLGYQNQAGVNSLSAQLAQCCCDIERGIDANTTQGVMNTNAIQQQIASCCCDLEKANMQNRFDAQAYNCNTLQAIDKLGDRIIDHLNAEKTQNLRDENQALRLAASQARQNEYLVNELRPCPIPAYITCNPYAASYGFGYGNGFGYNNGCGFNNGCGCGCN